MGDSLNSKPIFYDSDFLICFLEIGEVELLFNLFSKIIVPSPVYNELTTKKSPSLVKNTLNKLIDQNKVEVRELEFYSPEYTKYLCINKGYWTNGKAIGMGESSAMALAIENNGIVASNNLNDIFEICNQFDVPIVTVSIVLSKLYELNYISKKEAELLWLKIIKKNQILPKKDFITYYDELYDEDIDKLLKNCSL